MKHFKVPEGVDNISVGGQEFAVSEGIVAVENPTQELEKLLADHVGARPATLAEVEAAGNCISEREAKASVIEQLKAMGVTVDGRSSLATLDARLEREIAKAPAKKGSAP